MKVKVKYLLYVIAIIVFSVAFLFPISTANSYPPLLLDPDFSECKVSCPLGYTCVDQTRCIPNPEAPIDFESRCIITTTYGEKFICHFNFFSADRLNDWDESNDAGYEMICGNNHEYGCSSLEENHLIYKSVFDGIEIGSDEGVDEPCIPGEMIFIQECLLEF